MNQNSHTVRTLMVGPLCRDERFGSIVRRDAGRYDGTIAVFALLALLASDAALAQQQRQTFKDANGRILGRSVTDSRGNTTFYDSFGRDTGRAATDSRGNTSFYDSMGRNTGRSTTSNGTTTVYDNMGRQTGTIRRK